MNKSRQISAAQVFFLLLSARIGMVMALNLSVSEIAVNPSLLVYTACEMALTFFAVLPLLWLRRRNPDENVIDCLRRVTNRPFAFLIALIYVLFFIFSAAISVNRFGFFISAAISPLVSMHYFAVIIIACCAYMAARGIEALSRGIVFLMPVILTAALAVLIMPVSMVSLDRLMPLAFDAESGWSYVVRNVTSNTSIVALCMFLPNIKGRLCRSLVFYLITACVIVCFALFMIITVFGEFSTSLMFPVYVMSSLLGENVFYRLGVLHTSVWLFGLTVQITVSLTALTLAAQAVFKKIKTSAACLPGGIAAAALSLALAFDVDFEGYREMMTAYKAAFFFLLIAVPLFAVIADCIKRRPKRCEDCPARDK